MSSSHFQTKLNWHFAKSRLSIEFSRLLLPFFDKTTILEKTPNTPWACRILLVFFAHASVLTKTRRNVRVRSVTLDFVSHSMDNFVRMLTLNNNQESSSPHSQESIEAFCAAVTRNTQIWFVTVVGLMMLIRLNAYRIIENNCQSSWNFHTRHLCALISYYYYAYVAPLELVWAIESGKQ